LDGCLWVAFSFAPYFPCLRYAFLPLDLALDSLDGCQHYLPETAVLF
jgi:hypothetical protein